MPDITEVGKISPIENGQNAYDFRAAINLAIGGINNAFEAINQEYVEIGEMHKEVEDAKEDAKNAIIEATAGAVDVAIDAIEAAVGQGLGDIAKIKVGEDEPQATEEGYLPNFWYQIIE